MSLRYLVDTNILSQAFRADPGVLNMLRAHEGQIAAIAMVNGLTLVTDHVVDFRNFEHLRVENWFVRPPGP